MTPQFIQQHFEDRAAVRQELLQGLTQTSAVISPKFLYDALGSRLFEAITELPEYYPTRTEAAIFSQHLSAMAQVLPRQASLIDLGAGNCEKAARLFNALSPRRYVAVDISVEFLRHALLNLQQRHPSLPMVGVGLDFSATLDLPPQAGQASEGARLMFYPGSSIGNFSPAGALAFLRQVQAACGPNPHSGLLIGVDLVKDTATLEAAYDDALGVTAAFNRNLLRHVNQVAQTDFAVADWAHVALYDSARSRIEMHLQAQRALTVRWPGGARAFAQGERIHTENSYKWTLAGFADLLSEAGFAPTQHWCDQAQGFAVFWARAQAPA